MTFLHNQRTRLKVFGVHKLGSFIGSNTWQTNVKYLSTVPESFKSCDQFLKRHIGANEQETNKMLEKLKINNFDELIDKVIPKNIQTKVFRNDSQLKNEGLSETEALMKLKDIAKQNKVFKSFIGQGYYGTKTPSVILRSMLENPAWYTAYTPYQAEVSQGRLEMLLNFQTVVKDLTKMDVANCSLLDEGTSAAEAMHMAYAFHKSKRSKYFVSENLFKQSIGCIETRAKALGIELVIGNEEDFLSDSEDNLNQFCGAIIQYPDKYGNMKFDTYNSLSQKLKKSKIVFTIATDLLAMNLYKPPGELNCDIVIGSAQRFGVPMFYGGPHAGFMAVSNRFTRMMPGRLIGVTKDSYGKYALRMALQTREQYIKREKATSNICTAQALLANIAAAYAIYHGQEGLKEIAKSVLTKTEYVRDVLNKNGYKVLNKEEVFDTLTITGTKEELDLLEMKGFEKELNLFRQDTTHLSLSIDETTNEQDLNNLLSIFVNTLPSEVYEITSNDTHFRQDQTLPHPICNSFQSETKLLRYLATLEAKDITLRNSMIPLGSCTMKLNAASELLPVSWSEFKDIHPFAPKSQVGGYEILINELNTYLAEITGFEKVSSQPNSGANGEFAGLLTIRKYHEARNEGHRNICLIPMSAHGTNPASAVMAGMKVIGVKNTEDGRIDIADLKAKAEKYKEDLSCLMITYPSTYGVFEGEVKEVIEIVKSNGGKIYMDGANMNAQLCHTSPGNIGADVCHLNLHKTFAIPHGGGGPGVGSIGVNKDLAEFLPGHNVVDFVNGADPIGQVAAAPYGSAGILPISWMFISMLGKSGLEHCSNYAILNANYMAKELGEDYKILFTNENGFCAHEFILDLRFLSKLGLNEVDIAKRLADYGFHAGTMSWPVHGTMMIEPTESESKEECDRFIAAMKQIKKELNQIESGEVDVEKSVIKHAPHAAEVVVNDELWESVDRQYTRTEAVFPLPFVKHSKFWPSSRTDNAYGDRNLVCSCPPMEEYEN